MIRAAEALGVDLVDVLRSRRARREPAVLGRDLQAAERLAVARRVRELGDDGLAGKLAGADLGRRDALELVLLLRRRWAVDARIHRVAELGGQPTIELAQVAAADGADLGGEQRQEDAVL